jgi:hypothetical protein
MEKKLVVITEYGFYSGVLGTERFLVCEGNLIAWLKSKLYRLYVENGYNDNREQEKAIIDSLLNEFATGSQEFKGKISSGLGEIEIEIHDLIEVE